VAFLLARHQLLAQHYLLLIDPQEHRLRRLCQRYWGKGDEGRREIYKQNTSTVPHIGSDETDGVSNVVNVGDGTTDISGDVTYRYIDLGPDLTPFFGRYSTILLRQEYPAVLRHLRDVQSEPNTGGAVVTGQPGIGQPSRRLLNNSDNWDIGKSFFLYYILIERVLDAEPTLFQLDSKRAFMLFGQADVCVHHLERIDTEKYPGAWALVDSNASINEPRGELCVFESRFFLIQATSPQPSRWKEWAKQRDAPLVVMEAWSWQELYIGGFVHAIPLCILVFIESRRTHIESPALDAKALHRVFTLYGPSARLCYKLAKNEAKEKSWNKTIQSQLYNIPEPRTTQAAISGGSLNAQSEALIKASSQLITIYPDQDRQPRVALVSKHIAFQFFEVVFARDAMKFWQFFDQFWSVPQSRATAGWLWEAHVLRATFTDRKERTIHLKPLPTSSSTSSFTANSVSLPFSYVRTYGDGQDLARQLAGIIPSLLSGHRVLFVPGAPNQATFDAFSVSAAGIEAYQVTSAKGTHDLKSKGFDFLWDALVGAQNLVEGEYHNVVWRLFPSKKARWRIVFVVPKRVQDSWVKLQTVDFGGVTPKRKWGDYLLQYVMVLADRLEDDIAGQVAGSSRREQDVPSGGAPTRKAGVTSDAEVHLGKRREGLRERKAIAPEGQPRKTRKR
jgi:hypothetical protein